jgi:RHS repeat-associated protein
VTTVKAQHLQELRQAVNAVRGVAGLTAATWTDASLTSVVIKAAHIQELRDRLNEALSALSISVSPFTDPTLTVGGTLIRRVHVEELRQRASRGSGAGGGGPVTVPLDGHDSLTYDTATNRINSAGWGYDAAGNQIRTRTASGAWQRMEYDAAGRLVAVKSDAGVVISSYTYGNSNARLITHEGGSRTYYLWGGPGVLAEYLEADGTASANSPQWSKSYVYLGGRLLATEQPNGANDFVEYHHPDRLGTRIVTNNLSTNFYEQAALPYGTALDGESMGATNRRFTSYDRSSVTGLDYAVNRYYDSQQGRFTTVDPIGTGAATVEDPQSWNMYSYVGNDPINAVDPDGLFLKKLFKGIWKGIKAIGKVLSNRFVQIAIAIALTVITLGLAGPTVGFTFAAGEVSRNLTWLGVTQYVLGGALAAGAVARHVQDQGKGQDPEPPGTDVGGCGTIDNPCPIGTVNVSIVSRRTMIALIAGSGVLGAMAFTTLVAPKQALAIRKCFNNNRFSALAAGSRYHSFFKFIEVGPPISLASDVAATLAKAAGPQMGTQPYASGLNYGIRRLSDGVGSLFGRGARRSVLRALRPIGDRATFPLAVTGAFTLGYNTSIAVQCLTGVIE